MIKMYRICNKNRRLNNEGVSEIIGTILLVTITIVIASILIAWVQSTPAPTNKRHVALTSYLDLNATGGTVKITHNGGEILEDGTTTIYVVINDTSNKLRIKDGLNGSLKWSIGQTWSYYNTSITSNSSVAVSVIDMSTNEVLTSNTIQSVSAGGATGRTLIATAAYSDLSSIPADNTTQSRISTYIMYMDGSVPTNANVTANLTAIGGNSTEPLVYNSSSKLYETAQLKIPEGTTSGTYAVNVTAKDAAGSTVKSVVTITVTAPPSIPEGTTQILYTAVSENYAINGTTTDFSNMQSWTDGGAYGTLTEKGTGSAPGDPVQTTLRPNAAGTYQAWTTFGTGSAHYDRTSDQSDTTGIQITGSTASKETENLADPAFGDIDVVNSVTAYVKAQVSGQTFEYQQISFVGSTSATGNNPTSGSFSLPVGWGAGDVAIFRWYTYTDTKTFTLTGTGTGITQKYQTAPAGYGRLFIGYRVLQSGDSTFQWTSSSATGSTTVWGASVFRNVDTTGDPFEATSGSPATFTNAVNPDPPAVTTLTDKAWVYCVFGKRNDYTSITPPSGYTSAGQGRSTTGNDASAGAAYKEKTPAGNEDPAAWTLGGGATTDDGQVWTGALKPASSNPVEQVVILWRYGETDYEGTATTISRTAFTEYSVSLGALTKSQITELEVGMRASTLGTTESIQCSEIWVVVDYSPVVVTYTMEIQCNTTSIPSGKDAYYLQIYAKTDGEQFNISIYDGTNWNTKGSFASTLFTLFSYTLLPNEIINNALYVKCIDTTSDTVQSNLYIDYIRIKSVLSG